MGILRQRGFRPSPSNAGRWRLGIGLVVGISILPGMAFVGLELLWQDELDATGGDDFASSVAATEDHVFVGGSVENDQQDDDLAVRAYVRKTGLLAWEDRFDLEGRNDGVISIAVAKDGVFAAGLARSTQGGTDWIVRALEAKTGQFRWQDLVDKAGDIDVARSIATFGDRVFAAGETREVVGSVTQVDGLVRAYDGHSGQLLWEDQHDHAENFDTFTAIAASWGRVFVAGSVEDSGGDDDFLVRAYDSHSGQLAWQDVFDPTGQSDRASTVAARGGLVVVGGETTNSRGDRDFTVRAYWAPTGALLWEDRFDLAGGSDSANAVAIEGWSVFAAGTVENSAGDTDFFVRAYDAWSGWIRWDDQHDEAGGFDSALAVAATRRAVFVAGDLMNAQGDSDFAVRAYGPNAGFPLGQDVVDTGDFDRALAITAHGKDAYAAGFVQNGTSDFDWLARALRLH